MSYYFTDTETLELIRDRLRTMISRMDDTAGALRQMYNQMLTEFSFDQFPQWSQAVGCCGDAIEDTEMLTRRVEQFIAIVESAVDTYQENEKEHIHAISQLSARILSLQSGFAAVMSEGYPLGLVEGETSSAATQLEKQTSEAVQDLELSNLMAVTKVLENEYNYNKVVPVESMYYDEPRSMNDSDEEAAR